MVGTSTVTFAVAVPPAERGTDVGLIVADNDVEKNAERLMVPVKLSMLDSVRVEVPDSP